METRQRTIEQLVAVIVLGLLVVGCFLVLRPFVSSIMWAVILCFATWPLYVRLESRVRGHRTAAAGIMTASIALVLLAPFVLIGLTLADDIKDFADHVRVRLEAGPLSPPAWLERLPLIGVTLRDYWLSMTGDSSRLFADVRRVLPAMTAGLVALTGQIAKGIAELAMSIFIAFFLFRDGLAAAGRLTAAIDRLAGAEGRQLLDVAARTVRGVVYGILGTALVQAVVAGTGFAIAGIPGAGFLTLLTFFAAVIPVGAALVWIPAALWLFLTESIGWGIFMVVWGVLVSSVDNVVKPLIIRQGSQISFILILLGVLGGAMAFGFIGVFIGPTLLAVGFRLLDWWNAGRAAPAPAPAPPAPAPSLSP